MRLAATGLFVRASRNVRLGVLVHRGVSPALPLTSTSIRWASAQAAEKDEDWQSHTVAFPEQSVSTRSEVDPRKTSAASQSETQEEKTHRSADTSAAFKDELRSADEANKVIHGYGESGVLISGEPYVFDKTSNLSPSILALVNRTLYNTPNHPICITRKLIESVFPRPTFKHHSFPDPVATTYANFDVLGFPPDHPGRSRTDTYYINSKNVLRTHTSAHQHTAFEHMLNGEERGYTICADVFRRDSIDRSHFPVFHQMEGARMWRYEPRSSGSLMRHERKVPTGRKSSSNMYQMHMRRKEEIVQDLRDLPGHGLEVTGCLAFDQKTNPKQVQHDDEDVRLVVTHLKKSLEGLVYKVFTAAKEAGLGGEAAEQAEKLHVRWVEAYFPFTSPSFELEVFWQGEWLELLGCGITQERILANAGLRDHIGWAWGIGVERLAMLLFGIPDIRLFWSQDPRFLDQFEAGKIKKYEPFSKYPACYKDAAFWINAAPAAASPVDMGTTGVAAAAGGDATKASPTETQPAAFHENDVMEIVRDVAGSLAEDVSLVDEFVHPSTGRKSLCYRTNYRSLEKTLTNDEVNKMHAEVVRRLVTELGVELR